MNVLHNRPAAVTAGAAGAAALLMIALWVQGAAARTAAPSPARQSSSASHTVNVGGHGEVTVAPDMATITLGTETRGQDAQSALSSNNTTMNAVINAVEGQGVQSSHVQTSGLSIYYDSQRQAYVVDHSITVRLDDINKVGPVLDAAVAAGANNSWGVQFGIKDVSAARAKALQAAIQDARNQADTMAAALKVSITGVGSASSVQYSNPVPVPLPAASRAPAQASQPTPIQPGELTVTADVSVAYTFG